MIATTVLVLQHTSNWLNPQLGISNQQLYVEYVSNIYVAH